MRSPAGAFAWEFRHRHRWALIALAAYLLLLGLVKPLVLEPGQSVRFDPPDGFAAFGVVPFSGTFMYFLAVFSFGLAGDIAARQSIYPARLFTLPVTTAALARWPMLYGGMAVVALWLIAVLLARWPWGVELPLLWPAVMGAVVLAWTQVFTWMPYGLRGLRVVAATLVLITLDTLVILAIELDVSEASLVAFMVPQLPIAYGCAWLVLARARRGVVPDWTLSSGARARDGATTQPPFQSSRAAQLWFEWRRNGLSLPVMVAILLPFELGLLFIGGYGSPAFVFKVLIAVLLTPIVMAGFAAATASKANPLGRETYGVTPFTATRPLTSAEMIAAKLRMSMWSALAAWVVVLVAIPIGFSWSGADSVLIDWGRWTIAAIGMPRVMTLSLLGLAGLMALTWTMLVQSLYIGLTGREWLIKTSGFVGLAFFSLIGPFFEWIVDSPPAQRWLWDAWPLLAAALVAIKMIAAIWVAIRLSRSGLISDRVMVIGAAGWTLAVFLLYGALVWWVDTPLIPRHILALFAILAIPLVRVSAAPLALAWNRHR